LGWTDQETIALVGGGHTLGRAHGNCPNADADGFSRPCTVFDTEWVPTKSPEGNDQWGTADPKSPYAYAKTFRLTADLTLIADPAYKE
jgi:catalase (peroxidase I)